MGFKIRIRNHVEVVLWAMVVTVASVIGTHTYFWLFVDADLYFAALPHPLMIAVILGFGLGWVGCWQIMVGQHHHIALRKITDYDSLTGVLTRARFFKNAQEVDLERGALIMVDVDHFKQVNDTYGHPCGDAVLSRVARMLESCVRREDHVGRYGGEEFAILVDGADREEVCALAERLRSTIELSAVKYEGEVLSVSISLGLAYGRHEERIDSLIARADAALLAAKARGRNRVVCEHEMVPLPGGQSRIRRISRDMSRFS